MHDFVLASVGGVLIGLAAVMLLASHGSVMGVSGILSRLIPPVASDWTWRIAFIAGVIATPLIVVIFSGYQIPFEVTGNLGFIIPGGLLVGAGTVIGNGCTSGHGVCGLSRFSFRSLIATVIFMVVAVTTVFVIRQITGRG